MKPTMKWGFAALLALGPVAANAAPSAFVSKCGALTIPNETNATLVRDNEDCKLIWVLPPTAGTTTFTGYSPNGNLGMCKEVKLAQKLSARVLERMGKVNEEADSLNGEYKAALEKVAKARAKVNEELQKPETQLMREADTRLSTLDSRIESISKQLDNCNNSCDQLNAEYKELAKQRVQLHNDIRELRRKHVDAVRAYEKAKAVLESAELAAANVGKGYDAIQERQTKFRNELLNMLVFYSRTSAGEAHIDYDTGWDAAVEKLNQQYGNQYQFQKVRTSDARIFANIVGAGDKESYLSSMPSILDYSIQGMKYVPWGEEKTTEMTALPSRLVGNVRTSLLGGCPLYYKNFLEDESLTPSDTPQTYNYGISATYKYPAAYRFKMTASYNLYKFYEKIVKSRSKGGFFSSKTVTEVSETRDDKDTFEIDWNVEDPDSIYDEKARKEITADLKKELIGRVLGIMAQPVFATAPPMPISQPAQPEHGAIVLANGLQSTCGNVNVYCQAGVWILRGLDAIFGSSSAEQKFRSVHNTKATETWSANSVKWASGAMTFQSKK